MVAPRGRSTGTKLFVAKCVAPPPLACARCPARPCAARKRLQRNLNDYVQRMQAEAQVPQAQQQDPSKASTATALDWTKTFMQQASGRLHKKGLRGVGKRRAAVTLAAAPGDEAAGREAGDGEL